MDKLAALSMWIFPIHKLFINSLQQLINEWIKNKTNILKILELTGGESTKFADFYRITQVSVLTTVFQAASNDPASIEM